MLIVASYSAALLLQVLEALIVKVLADPFIFFFLPQTGIFSLPSHTTSVRCDFVKQGRRRRYSDSSFPALAFAKRTGHIVSSGFVDLSLALKVSAAFSSGT